MTRNMYSFKGLPDDLITLMNYTSKAMEECNFPMEDILKYREFYITSRNNFMKATYRIIAKCNEMVFKEREERKENEKYFILNSINDVNS